MPLHAIHDLPLPRHAGRWCARVSGQPSHHGQTLYLQDKSCAIYGIMSSNTRLVRQDGVPRDMKTPAGRRSRCAMPSTRTDDKPLAAETGERADLNAFFCCFGSLFCCVLALWHLGWPEIAMADEPPARGAHTETPALACCCTSLHMQQAVGPGPVPDTSLTAVLTGMKKSERKKQALVDAREATYDAAALAQAIAAAELKRAHHADKQLRSEWKYLVQLSMLCVVWHGMSACATAACKYPVCAHQGSIMLAVMSASMDRMQGHPVFLCGSL